MMRSFGDLVRGAEFPRCLEVTTQQCESEVLTTAPPPRPPPPPRLPPASDALQKVQGLRNFSSAPPDLKAHFKQH